MATAHSQGSGVRLRDALAQRHDMGFGRNVRQRWLHSEEIDAPVDTAGRGDLPRRQVLRLEGPHNQLNPKP